jgi:aryl-alcohol dehydrogenase-like predicted oxidoreductase
MQLAGASVPPKDHDAALVVLREAVTCGVNHIDTSDFYGAGTFSVIEIWRPANCQPTEIRRWWKPAQGKEIVCMARGSTPGSVVSTGS